MARRTRRHKQMPDKMAETQAVVGRKKADAQGVKQPARHQPEQAPRGHQRPQRLDGDQGDPPIATYSPVESHGQRTPATDFKTMPASAMAQTSPNSVQPPRAAQHAKRKRRVGAGSAGQAQAVLAGALTFGCLTRADGCERLNQMTP